VHLEYLFPFSDSKCDQNARIPAFSTPGSSVPYFSHKMGNKVATQDHTSGITAYCHMVFTRQCKTVLVLFRLLASSALLLCITATISHDGCWLMVDVRLDRFLKEKCDVAHYHKGFIVYITILTVLWFEYCLKRWPWSCHNKERYFVEWNCCFSDTDVFCGVNLNFVRYTTTSVLSQLFLKEFLHIISSSKML